MKTTPFNILAAVSALLTLAVNAQEKPIRILPVPAPQPGIAVEPAPPPLPIALPPAVNIGEPEMPDEGWAEPGFPGDMIMPEMHMPGRFRIITAQLSLSGKNTPVILKLDTMTGQTWELKLTEQKFFFNGKPHVRTQLAFELVAQKAAPVHAQAHGDEEGHHGRVRPELNAPDEPAVIEAVPVRPKQPRRPFFFPKQPRRNIPEDVPVPTPQREDRKRGSQR